MPGFDDGFDDGRAVCLEGPCALAWRWRSLARKPRWPFARSICAGVRRLGVRISERSAGVMPCA